MQLTPLAPVLCLLLLCKPTSSAAAGVNVTTVDSHTAYISPTSSPDDMQLRRALSNESVTTIVFTGDYSVGKTQFKDYTLPYKEGMPLLEITRNVTLTGLPGQLPLLDLDFEMSAVELCDNCTFTITNMAIANERRGANAQIDFLLGHGNSIMNLTNVIRKRMSCTAIEPELLLVQITNRAARFPAKNGSMNQIYAADDVTFRDVVYPKTLHLIDYSAEFPRHYDGGYNLLLHNVYRMCDGFVDNDCLKTSNADQCVATHISQLLESQSSSSRPGSGAGLAPAVVAGIAVAAAVGVAAVLGVVAALLLHHRKAIAQAAADGPTVKDVETGGSKCMQHHGSSSTAPPSSDQGTSLRCTIKTAPGVGIMAFEGGVYGNGTGHSSGSTHALEPAPGLVASNYDLVFGALLGSGSFGRVYRARWKDKYVAVKVIEHDPRMVSAVANEVQLMLSCYHPNVVRAYHYITHSTTGSTTADLLWTAGGSSDQSASLATLAAGQLQQQNPAGSTTQGAQVPSSGGAVSSAALHCTTGRSSAGAMLQMLSHAATGSAQSTPEGTSQLQQERGGSTTSSGQERGTSGSGLARAQAPNTEQQQQQRHEVQSGLLGHTLPPAVPQQLCGVLGRPAGSGTAAAPMAGLTDDSQWENVRTWLIQEFCDCGTLTKMSASWSVLNEDDAQMLKRLTMLQDVARGLRYLHGRHVVHGDLNSRNVLITTHPGSLAGYTAKLADLGLSRTIKQHATHHTTCTVGTMSHMPPELLRYGRMSTSVDIYSFGIMMWELFSREVAFRELHYGQFFETVVLRDLHPQVPANMPEDYKLLMERCWSTDPAARPSSKVVCKCVALMLAERQQVLGLQEAQLCSSDDEATAAAPAAVDESSCVD